MKTLTLLIFTLFITQSFNSDRDCSDVYYEADNASSYSEKSYYADNVNDMRQYAREAVEAFNNVMSYADECDCEKAYYAANDGYDNAKKAANSGNLNDGRYYAEKAKKYADDAMSHADYCTD